MLKVIGAGVGRTGTTSLRAALEQLLGGRCYHMLEVFPRPDDIPVWHAAMRGEAVDYRALLADFAAAVDWPASAVWEPLSHAYPDALIVLSTRTDAETWWRSASNTIFPTMLEASPGPWRDMVWEMVTRRFTANIEDKAAAMAAYDAHNAYVRANAPAARLLDWRADEGWGPLCAALDLPVPNEPFPHANTTEDFQELRRNHAK